MADDFSFLTDSEDERAVEDVLSQALDHSVLEQIAAINCSSFSNSDNLPSDLETRFRKLKSLPATINSTAAPRFPPAKSKSFKPRSVDDLNTDKSHPSFCKSVDFEQIPDRRKSSVKSSPIYSPEEYSGEHRDEKKTTKPNRKPKSSPNTDRRKFSQKSPPIDSPEEHSDEHRDEKKTTKSKRKPNSSSDSDSNSEVRKQKDLKSKSKSKSGTGSAKSRSDSWSESLSPESDTGTLSPPRRRIGCLWCSPKKEKSVSKKQGKENRLWSSSSFGSDYGSELLKSFSTKEQKKIMKKAMKEEEKINREAEKIVKWAKQASARMMDVNVTGLDDELSDLEK